MKAKLTVCLHDSFLSELEGEMRPAYGLRIAISA